ncbi:MAG: PepSY-associated TM helix domain-containing protein, partial [Pseudoxanthomonas sp.]
MKEGFRQSMAWLHTWSGLLVGWVLLMVFACGTAAYFRDETTLWMKPELHRVQPVSRTDADTALAVAEQFLARHAAGSARWNITLPTEREEALRVSWTRPAPPDAAAAKPGERPRRQRPETALLSPQTGERLPQARETRGGDFFYQLHFNLHYVPVLWGRWIVGICAMFMLVAIVSGVITHRRIFADFFTFRARKGQRSWLDAHNVSAVLALPYHAMITYTGLVTLMFMYMPWAPKVVYEGDQRTYVAEVFPTARGAQSPKPTGTPAPLAPLAAIARASSQAWGGAGVASLTIHNPGDASARVVATRHERGTLTSNQASITFDGVDGTLVGRNGENIAPASNTRGVLYGLHLGRFSDMGLRWLFFVSGLAGCAMVATGLLL